MLGSAYTSEGLSLMMMIGITESRSWMTMKISFGRRHVGIINISAEQRCFESCVVLRATNYHFLEV